MLWQARPVRLEGPRRLPTNDHKSHLAALTGVRALLAVWVVLHHLTGPGMLLDAWVQSLPHAAAALIHQGYLAVGTFFVLSGFVLARSYGSENWNRPSLARYGMARVARVYPVYVLSLVVVLPFIAREVLPLDPQRAGWVANYALLLQGWTGALPVNWNTPAWSLSCEMFFYLCFPALALATKRLSPRGAVALGVAMWIWPAVLMRAGVPDGIKPLLHVSDFVTGIAAARAFELMRRRGLRGRGYWLYAPAAAIALAFLLDPESAYGIVDPNSALRPLNALILVGLALGGGLPVRLLSSRAAVLMGKASYATYILHVPVLWWYVRAAQRFAPGLPSTASAFVFMALMLAVSVLVYRFVEEPANRRLRALAGCQHRASAV